MPVSSCNTLLVNFESGQLGAAGSCVTAGQIGRIVLTGTGYNEQVASGVALLQD